MIQHKPKQQRRVSRRTLRNIGLVFLVGVLALGIFARDHIQSWLYGEETPPTQAVVIPPADETDVDVAGDWLGVITEDYGLEVRYEFRLSLQQRGDDVTGTMTVTSTNAPRTTIFAVSNVRGDVNGDILTLAETRVTSLEGISANYWCKIAIQLDHDENSSDDDTMTGKWNGIATDGVEGCLGTEGRVTLMQDAR